MKFAGLVAVAGLAGAGERFRFARLGIDDLDLVVVGVGDINLAVEIIDVEAVLQLGVGSRAVDDRQRRTAGPAGR